MMTTQTVTEIAAYGRNTRMVEVLFSDDTLCTVSRAKDGTYRVAAGMAARSVGYASTVEPLDPLFIAAVAAARVYV